MRMRVVLLIILAFLCPLNAQTVTKVLISGENTSHDTNVKNAFLKGYSSFDSTFYSGEIVLHADYTPSNAIKYAHDNGFQIAIRSYTGLNTIVDDSARKCPDLQLFMPAGSNSFIYICNLDMSNNAVVVTGAGNDTLVTGYPVEFYSVDPITTSNLSSFSNGYIAGQIAYIANHFNISLAQARIVARNNSIKYQSPQFVVYGKLNQSAGISILPVELTSFTGRYVNKNICLNWTTATEISNYGFDVERSKDNLSWEKIAFIKGGGNCNAPRNYSYTDGTALNSRCCYRLKQIDTDGKYQYSNSIEVSNALIQNAITLYQNYPNPFNPFTNIGFNLPSATKVTIRVFNSIGAEVAKIIDGMLPAGYNEVRFDASKLASGYYIYSIEAAGCRKNMKMVLLK